MAGVLNDPARLRAAEDKLSRLAQAELRRFAGKVDWSKTDHDSPALSDLFQVVAVKIVDRYASAAATLAADFYDECRAMAGVKVPFRALAQPAPPAEGIQAQTRFAARWLFGAKPRPAKMIDFLTGEVDKKVKQAFRDTIAVSASADPARPLLRRQTAGTCEFCQQLADRDYRMARRGADRSEVNEYHPNCQCVPVAVWAGDTGTVMTGRFASKLQDVIRRAEAHGTVVQAQAAQTVARAHPPTFADLAAYLAPPTDPHKFFTETAERLAAQRLEQALGIKLRSVDAVNRHRDLQHSGTARSAASMKTPDAVIDGTDIPLEVKSLSASGERPGAVAVADRIRGGARQARVVVIDGAERGITAAEARDGIASAVRRAGDDLDMVVVLLRQALTVWGSQRGPG